MKKIEVITYDTELEFQFGDTNNSVIELYNIFISSGMSERFIPDSFKKLYNDEMLKLKQIERIKKLENINKKYEKE